MALQIRRGTNKERLQITPAEGELIYVTDYELATISGTAINATTNVITSVAHGLITNQQIRFQDTTKNGLTLNQVYYVASTPDPDNFTLKATLAGATLDITGTYTVPLVFATGPTNAAGVPTGINVTALWIGDGNTVGGVPGNTQGLDDLTDVQITTPTEGNTLYYDATTKQWKNTNILNIDDVSGTQNIYINATGDSTIKRTTSTNPNLGHSILNLYNDASTATPVNGFGSVLAFYADNAVGTAKYLGYANFKYDDITTGQEDAGLSIVLMENGVDPSYPTPGTVGAQLRLDSAGNLAVRGDLTINNDTGNNQSTINFNHPTATGSITWQGTAHFLSGDLVVNGGTDNVVEIGAATNTGIANIFNGAIGTINMGNGVVTELNLGNAAAGSRVRVKSPQTDIDGALTVTGNLTVNGTTTTVNSATMTVDDPNIVLNATTATPTDTTANGGGITVRGTTDKSLNWDNTTKRWWFTNGTGGTVDNNHPMVVDLTDIRSVETTAFNKGQMFLYDGTNWVNSRNLTFNDEDYRPWINTQVDNATNSVNSALILMKDYDTNSYGNGAGTGIVFGVDSNGQGAIGLSRINAVYDSAGVHNIKLQTNITSNTYNTLIETNTARTNINNGVLYVNATNGRVGINTVSPNLSLEVQGNAYVSTTLEVVQDITGRSNVNVGGETITMNYGFTGAPSQNVAIVVERGDQPDAWWRWTENGDYWNTNYSIIADGSITAVGALGTNGLNIYFNNDDATPAGTDNANLVVKRGGGADVSLRWNEGSDRWEFTNDGSTYTLMPVATDTPTYAGLNTTTGNINVNNKTILRGDNGNVVVGNDIFASGNLLQFNFGQTGQPIINAGIEIERGDQANTTFRWNEGNERWESTVDGTSYLALPNQTLDQTSSPTFAALYTNGLISTSGSTALVSVNNKTFLYADTGDVRTGGDLHVGGDFIRLNEKQTGSNPAAFVDAYFIAERGDAPGGDAFLKWNETTDYWNTSHNLLVGGDLTVTGNGYIYSSTGLPLILSGADVKVEGNLTLGGNTIKASNGTTAIETTTSGVVITGNDVAVRGNAVVLNYLTTGTPTLNAGIDVQRGDSPTTTLLWNEGTDRWQFTNNGTNYTNLPVATDTLTYAGLNITNDISATNITATGNLTLTGNTIKKSGGTDVITFSGTNLTTFAGDIKLGGDSVYSSTGWRMFDYRETASIYGTSYQVKMNADKNIGLGASYLYLDNMVEMNTSSLTTTSNSTYSVLDYFDPASYRSAKYIVQITNGTTHQMWEGMVIHDGTDIFISAYGDLRTNGNLATMSVGFNATTGYPELRVTPVNATQTKFKATKTYIAV